MRRLLQENLTPYDTRLANTDDEELQWCLVKNDHLLNDPKYSRMYSLDKENRTALLNALTARIQSLKAGEKENTNNTEEVTSIEGARIFFLDMLKPFK